MFATGKSPYHFDKMCRNLPRRGKNGHTRQFFVPQFQTSDDFRAKNIPVEMQLGNDVLDQIAANVNFTEQTEQDNSLNDQYKRVKIEETKVRTKHLNQKLDQRKKLLFAQWSEKFFNQFADNFGRLRNVLVAMHLSEEQVNVFNETLDHCLNNLQLSLDNIWNQFKNEDEEDEQT